MALDLSLREIADQFLETSKQTGTSTDSEMLKALAGVYCKRAQELERRKVERKSERQA